jgi:hypothetical protein
MRHTPSKQRIVDEATFWMRLVVVVLVVLIAVKFSGESGPDQAGSDYFQWFKDAGYPASYWQ